LGGRICVAGYYPWTLLHFFSKLRQLKSIARWLSGDTLPAYVGSGHRAYLWVREAQTGGLALCVINAHFDPAEDLSLLIRTSADEATVYGMDCAQSRLACSGEDGPYRAFVLPSVEPWTLQMIVAE